MFIILAYCVSLLKSEFIHYLLLCFSFCLIFRCVADLFILTVCSVNFTFPTRLERLRPETVVISFDCGFQRLVLDTLCSKVSTTGAV